MACGSCGGKRANTEYEVTFRDGSTTRVKSMAEVRLKIAADTTVGSRAPSHRVVPKIAKSA